MGPKMLSVILDGEALCKWIHSYTQGDCRCVYPVSWTEQLSLGGRVRFPWGQFAGPATNHQCNCGQGHLGGRQGGNGQPRLHSASEASLAQNPG